MFEREYLFIWIAVGLIAVTIAVAAAWLDPAAHKINSRVAEFEERYGQHKRRRTARGQRRDTATSLVGRLASMLPSTSSASGTLQARLSKGGIYNPSASSTFLGVQTLLTLTPAVVAILGALFFNWSLSFALAAGGLAAAAGWLAPGLWLDRAVKERHLLLRRSLPDFLDLMVVCLQGGLSIQETIRRVGDELRLAHPILAGELSIVQRDVELGATVDQAFRRFALRSDYEGVRTLSTFVRESQRFGTQLTEALRLHAEMLRLQREEAAEEQAQKAAVAILLPTLLLIFPAVFVVLVGPAMIQIQEAFAK
ncbi:type II secretion system F family protein [Lacipirellula parvula]|uniref:TadC n=1 Tax=Lacipirellula parvula TaxID=2650471 RepID=A0A5K7X8V2_9BACT|nr:type II secretion system F family protein [Lacipirellula parvula]BBO33080.1 tadC [Lacipirellula parvula]